MLEFVGFVLLPMFLVALMWAVRFAPEIADWARARKSNFQNKRRARKHRNDPIYERIAKAHEWKAETYLRKGDIEQARDEFRKAEKTRREAMEAMMNGQEPKL